MSNDIEKIIDNNKKLFIEFLGLKKESQSGLLQEIQKETIKPQSYLLDSINKDPFKDPLFIDKYIPNKIYNTVNDIDDLTNDFFKKKNKITYVIPDRKTQGILVSGDWGIGKTSFVKQVLEKKKKTKHYIAYIDSWECYPSKEILLDIYSQILDQRSYLKEFWYYRKYFFGFIWFINIILAFFYIKETNLYDFIISISPIILSFVGWGIYKLTKSFHTEIKEKIEKEVAKRGLILVIDEMDRLDKQFFQELMIHLRTILTINNTFYIYIWNENIMKELMPNYNAFKAKYIQNDFEYPQLDFMRDFWIRFKSTITEIPYEEIFIDKYIYFMSNILFINSKPIREQKSMLRIQIDNIKLFANVGLLFLYQNLCINFLREKIFDLDVDNNILVDENDVSEKFSIEYIAYFYENLQENNYLSTINFYKENGTINTDIFLIDSLITNWFEQNSLEQSKKGIPPYLKDYIQKMIEEDSSEYKYIRYICLLSISFTKDENDINLILPGAPSLIEQIQLNKHRILSYFIQLNPNRWKEFYEQYNYSFLKEVREIIKEVLNL